MWSARTPPTSRSTEYYRQTQPPLPPPPPPPNGSVPFDQVEQGNYYALNPAIVPTDSEDLEETLEEIVELEGELSSDEEASMLSGESMGFSNGIKTAASASGVSMPFEGINFAQLFSASNAHSEKLITLAKQFYPVSF